LSFKEDEPKPIKQRIFPGNENLLKFKENIVTQVITFEKYSIELQQNSLTDSFHKIDLEDATKQELDDIKQLLVIVFSTNVVPKQ
jgi:hypothetical protein